MRLMDIRTLKLKCGDLMRDLAIARGSSNQMDELRRETFQLQRDLLQVRSAFSVPRCASRFFLKAFQDYTWHNAHSHCFEHLYSVAFPPW